MQRTITALFCVSIIFITFYVSPSNGQAINGDFSNGLFGWDISGDVTISPDGTAILRTGGAEGQYITSLSTDFIITGRILTFKYYFDIVGPDKIKYPGYPSFGPDFFQMSLYTDEGKSFDMPLTWNPTYGFVPYSLDVSSIAAGTKVTVSFMLFDEDDGYLSVAGIDDISDPPASTPESGTLLLLGGGLLGLFIYGRYMGGRGEFCGGFEIRFIKVMLCIPILFMTQVCSSNVVYGELIETTVAEMTRLDFTAPLFNTRTNILTLEMTATNISDTSIFTPLKVVITGTSTPDVKVANPDGYTPEGLPYFDLTSNISDKELSPGEKMSVKKISFYNPRRVKFRWDQDVVAFIDVHKGEAPVIDSVCLTAGEAPPLCEFYYEDIGVEDPEYIRLPQGPLPEMYKYEKVRVYAFDNEGLPITVMINGIEAIFSEEGSYYYCDMELKEGINNISIIVTNNSGLSTTRDLSLNIDSTAPSINVLEPADGTIVTILDQVITGTVDDPYVNYVVLRKDFFSSEDVPVYDRTFRRNVTLSPGHNDISISATDTAGNLANYNFDVIYVYSELGVITGRVYNSILGLPVAGVVITVIGDSGDYKTTVSSEDGSYRFEGVRSGDITMLVDKDGYSPERTNIFSPGGVTPFRQDIGLVPVNAPDTFTLTGQVKDTGGSPISEAIVSIRGTSLSGGSDHNGIYIITGIPRESFVAETSKKMYEDTSLNVNAGIYSNNTKILTFDFVLREFVSTIEIISPSDGGYISGDTTLVVGFVRNGGGDAGVGVRVNGILAQVYNGYFMANDVPLAEGVNRITAELIDTSGTLLSGSVNVILEQRDKGVVIIHAWEAGIVPAAVSIDIEEPPGVSLVDYSIEVSGPGTTELTSDGPLKYRVFITRPGIYTFKFKGVDSMGNRYEDTYGFTGVIREELEEVLKQIWAKFKYGLIENKIDDAASLVTPETRSRYAEQLFLLGNRLPDVFSSISDIQLISLVDNIAKTRVYDGDITHYIWFMRDIYGQWKINKF